MAVLVHVLVLRYASPSHDCSLCCEAHRRREKRQLSRVKPRPRAEPDPRFYDTKERDWRKSMFEE